MRRRAPPIIAFAPLSHMLNHGFFFNHGFFKAVLQSNHHHRRSDAFDP